jgi:hypothetical protein
VAGAFEITANRLACAAEMTREERLYNLFHSQIVGGDPGASVATGGGAAADPCPSLATPMAAQSISTCPGAKCTAKKGVVSSDALPG